jgi:hypothetical protein
MNAFESTCRLRKYCKEIVEAKGVSTLWKYFLETKSVSARQQMAILPGYMHSLRVLICLRDIMKNSSPDVAVSVIEPEEIVKLIDDELAREMDDGMFGILGILDQLVMYDPSKGTDKLIKMRWLLKVKYEILF